MPSIAVHLAAADILAEPLKVKDMPAYLLGCIAPDRVNADGFAPAEQRYAAHIRSRDIEQWKANIAEFCRERAATDFIKGFALHLFTDIAWDEAVQPQLFEYLRGKGIPEDELNSAKWDELRGFDSLLSKSESYPRDIELLRRSTADSAGDTGIDKAGLEKWRDKITALQYPYPPCGFLSEEHIKTAAELALLYMEQVFEI